MKAASKVAERFKHALKTIKLEDWGLEGMLTGKSVTLFHGTTRLFRAFDLEQSRDELVNNFYGRGIFLTPSKQVAEMYAEANRNIGFLPSIISDLARKKPIAGAFLKSLYEHGQEGWEIFWKANGYWTENPPPGVGQVDMDRFQADLGVDSNDLSDVADYILGSKSEPLSGGPINIFNTSTGMPGYVYDTLDAIGLNSKVYRPKVYTVSCTVSNPLLTNSQSKARKARAQGYDSVVYFGPDLVRGIPEVAVFNPRNVKVRGIKVID